MADISTGGNVDVLSSYDRSRVHMLGGQVTDLEHHGWGLYNDGLCLSGGYINNLLAVTSMTYLNGTHVNHLCFEGYTRSLMSAGEVDELNVGGNPDYFDYGWIDLVGGTIHTINDYSTGFVTTIIFHGYNFSLGPGLSLDGDRLLGSGILSGSPLYHHVGHWYTQINQYNSDSRIFLLPEPATIVLLGLGGFFLRRRK